jgi:large subunit ribosomal protein L19
MVEIKVQEIKPGMEIRVHQKIKELDAKGNPKERIQVFEGIVIARRGGNQPGATFTVRKIGADGVGIEKIYPIHSPTIVKIEVVRKYKTRKAKLYYLRNYKKKLKEIKK